MLLTFIGGFKVRLSWTIAQALTQIHIRKHHFFGVPNFIEKSRTRHTWECVVDNRERERERESMDLRTKGFEGSEIPEMEPRLLQHGGLVTGRGGSILDLEDQAVVGAGHDLSLALWYLDQRQLCPRTLVVLAHRVVRDLRHVAVVHVLDGAPAAQRRFRPPGSVGDQDEGEEKETVVSHFESNAGS